MPQPHGLGRGLASLIPQRKTSGTGSDSNQGKKESLRGPFRAIPVSKIYPLENVPKTAEEQHQKSSEADSADVLESPTSLSKPVFDLPPNLPKKMTIQTDSDLATPFPLEPVSEPTEEPVVSVATPTSQENISSTPISVSKNNPPDSVIAPTPSEIISLTPTSAPESDPLEGNALFVLTGDVVPNPHQPRAHFNEEKLLELAQSIREHGILQPLIVTRSGDKYELIAGERRLQASKMVGLERVPVIVREAENQEKFELSIIENIQRHDLNPIEEARAYDRLAGEFQLSQEDIAKKMGRSRSAIANTLRLLQLPIEIQQAVASGKISEGHAKAILSIENSEKQRALFDLIVKQGLTVRETEKRSREVSTHPPRKTAPKDPEIESKENILSEIFGTKVRITKTGTGGSIRVDYFSDEEFQNIFSKLSGMAKAGE